MKFIDVGYANPTEPGAFGNGRYFDPALLVLEPGEAQIAHWIVEAANGPKNIFVRELQNHIEEADPKADIELKGDFALQVYLRVIEVASDRLTNQCCRRVSTPRGMSLVARQLLAAAEIGVAAPAESVVGGTAFYDMAAYELTEQALDGTIGYTGEEDARVTGSGDSSVRPQPVAAGAVA